MSIGLRMAGVMSQRRPVVPTLHPMTADYIARLQAVDGHEPAFDAANDYLIRELVALGGAYWDSSFTMTTLAGKKWEGLLIPLRNGMNEGGNVGFITSDYNAKTGLIGGGTKHLTSGHTTTAATQTDFSIFCYASTAHPSGSAGAYIGTVNGNGYRWMLRSGVVPTALQTGFMASATNNSATGDATGFLGVSRDNESNYDFRRMGSTVEITETAFNHPADVPVNVFRLGVSSFYGRPRLAFYGLSPALNLATLDGILTEYMARIEAAGL